MAGVLRQALMCGTAAALAGAFTLANAQPVSGSDVLERYSSLRSYCDAGRRTGYAGWDSFERCASTDGRFRHVERESSGTLRAKWSDARTHYSYVTFRDTGTYQEHPLASAQFDRRYSDRDQIFALFVFELFSLYTRNDRAQLADYIGTYKRNEVLSNAEYTVLERQGTHAGNATTEERMWILNSDRSIRRYEHRGDPANVRVVEVQSVEFDRPLPAAALRFDAPLLARYSMSSNPAVFIGALMVVAALAGSILWAALFARAAAFEATLRTRKRLWRIHLWLFGLTGLALAALAVLTPPGGGHPPAIVIVYVLAIWWGIACGMVSAFMLASYPVELWFRRRFSSRSPHSRAA